MKYGESAFDIIYLLFAVTAGVIVLIRRKDSIGRLMGSSALILGAGDAFHLVPRVLNYFVEDDLTVWLGTGKLVTSITMTIFYVLLFFLHTRLFNREDNGRDRICMAVLLLVAALRTVICLLPGNDWINGGSSVFWGILRNIPFVIIGIIIVIIYFKTREKNRNFRRVWIYISLSFLFYIPVAVAASLLPVLGMLMLPKTICYMLILGVFLKESSN
ncbi:hypothetical protein SAMN02910456_01323 [Ruminococcaceae bacterium YRB3002]|nr:hypothetical protein SAMN02910456_01323 [Ruminococcaceae bacterium YRB3002]